MGTTLFNITNLWQNYFIRKVGLEAKLPRLRDVSEKVNSENYLKKILEVFPVQCVFLYICIWSVFLMSA